MHTCVFYRSPHSTNAVRCLVLLLLSGPVISACGDGSQSPDAAWTSAALSQQVQVRRDAIVESTNDVAQAWRQVGALISTTTDVCSGTLIAPDVVLTAGHCLDSFTGNTTTLQELNPWQMWFTQKTYAFPLGLAAPIKVKHAVVHINYQPDRYLKLPLIQRLPENAAEQAVIDRLHANCGSSQNPFNEQNYLQCVAQQPVELLRDLGFTDRTMQMGDVGLAFLEKPIDDVTPVRLPTASLRLQDNRLDTIVGYGYHSYDKWYSTALGVRHVGSARVASLGDYEILVARGAGALCGGDSGGPLLRQVENALEVIGIASRVGFDAEGHCTDPFIMTRVDAYADWIRTQMQAACRNGLRSAAACRSPAA